MRGSIERLLAESDLLAFEIGIERGRPGSVMCAYNQVNGVYACENDWLLSEVLKGDWKYPGFVMSDWGAVHSTAKAALAGLDQESGEQLDTQNFFGSLGQAVASGEVPRARIDDMVWRILAAMFAHGLMAEPIDPPPADLVTSDAAALAIEREGAVLLRNEAYCRSRRIRADPGRRRACEPRVPSGAVRRRLLRAAESRCTERIGRISRDDFRFLFAAPSDTTATFLDASIGYDDGRSPNARPPRPREAGAVVLFARPVNTETR